MSPREPEGAAPCAVSHSEEGRSFRFTRRSDGVVVKVRRKVVAPPCICKESTTVVLPLP